MKIEEEKEMIIDVYCKNCKYLAIDEMTLCEEVCDYICEYSDNKGDDHFDWYGNYIKIEQIQHPSVKNMNNDCNWYEQK